MKDRGKEWKASNIALRTMEVFGQRIDEMLKGQKALVIMHGPPGITKNTTESNHE